MKFPTILSLSIALFAAPILKADTSLTFEPKGTPKGKQVVLLAGDEEYRSEEAMPMIGKILSQKHGFSCTVLFAADEDGTVRPEKQDSLTNPEALDKADVIVMSLRFRNWNAETVAKFKGAVNRGVPIIGLRTSTHAFNGKGDPELAKFGKEVLGEGWISHWGVHKGQATKGVTEPGAENEALLRGVTDVFGTSDVYEVYPPADAKILIRGQVLVGMKPTDAPATNQKKRATDKEMQGVNEPMMPVAWTREVANKAGTKNKVLCTTMGAATDLDSEGLRRLVVNGVYWGVGLEVPEKADVEYVDPYKPTMYGFKGSIPGLKVDDFQLGKPWPGKVVEKAPDKAPDTK